MVNIIIVVLVSYYMLLVKVLISGAGHTASEGLAVSILGRTT